MDHPIRFLTLITWLIAMLVCFSFFRTRFTRVIVMEYETGVLFKKGKLDKIVQAGAYWIDRVTTTLTKVEMRTRLLQIAGQEVLTADSVGLKISLAVQFRVLDAKTAVLNSENFYMALYTAIQLAVREVVGANAIDDVLANRNDMGAKILQLCTAGATTLGMEVSSVAIKDIMLTGELKKVFAQVVKARKEGQAALERARGESAALRNLANAAKLMEDNPTLLQLRALQSLSDSGGNTLVLGVPGNALPLTKSSIGRAMKQNDQPATGDDG